MQANVLQPADHPGILLRQHDADQQHNQTEAQDTAAGEPFGIEQGIAAVMLEGDGSDDQHHRRRQRPADPRRFEPPLEPPHRQHRAHQRHAGGQQEEGDKILLLEHLFTIARRQLQRDDAGQRHQRQPQFKEVEPAPFVGLQQLGGKEARQRNGQRRASDTDGQPFKAVACGPGLHLIVDPQRAERRGHHAVGGADHHRRAEIVDEQVEEGDQHIEHQKAFGKGAQPELLTKFHQQQVDGDVGHDIHRRQPGDLRRPGGEGALQQLQIGGDYRVAQRAGEAHQQPDHPVGQALRRAVQRRRWRAEQGRFFMRRPVMGGVRVTLTTGHYFFSTSRNSFSSTR